MVVTNPSLKHSRKRDEHIFRCVQTCRSSSVVEAAGRLFITDEGLSLALGYDTFCRNR